MATDGSIELFQPSLYFGCRRYPVLESFILAYDAIDVSEKASRNRMTFVEPSQLFGDGVEVQLHCGGGLHVMRLVNIP
jgi:hypothetical protein